MNLAGRPPAPHSGRYKKPEPVPGENLIEDSSRWLSSSVIAQKYIIGARLTLDHYIETQPSSSD